MKPRAPARGDRVLKTLDRLLSKAGVGSRTEARRWIAARRVTVNGAVVTDPDRWVDPERDRVAFDGKPLRAPRRIHLLLYKPKGYLTTYDDPQGRKTVFALLPPGTPYVFPVGRLDLDTSGLLLLTNDSAFAEAVANPENKVPKTYLVKTSTHLDDAALEVLRCGVTLEDGPTRPARVTRVREAGGRTVFTITITEGRNRQVRRMVEAAGGKVLKLVRTAIGPLTLEGLVVGGCRPLTPREIALLVGAPPKLSAEARAPRAASVPRRSSSRARNRPRNAPRRRGGGKA